MIDKIIVWWNLRVLQYWMWRARRKQYHTPRHWQCQMIGGGGIQLGFLKRLEAIQQVTALNGGPIIYVDDEYGIIIYGHPPEAPAPGSEKKQ